jgi:ABC-type branched-subunit amino acid transport system substrate-binding protein
VAPFSGEHAALGEALANAAALALEDLAPAGVVVEVVTVDACDAASAAAAAARLRDDPGITAVLGPGCSVSAGELLPVMEEVGVAMVSASATGPGLGELAPGTFHRVVLDDGALSAAGRDVAYVEERVEVQDLFARYEERFGGLPAGLYRPFIAYGYDAAGVLLHALGQVAGGDLDRASLVAAVRATDGYPGVTGTISFDTVGDRRDA